MEFVAVVSYGIVGLIALAAAALGAWAGARLVMRSLRHDNVLGAFYPADDIEAVDDPRHAPASTVGSGVPGVDALQFDALDGVFGSIRSLSEQVARTQQGQQNIDLFHEFMRLEAIASMAAPLFGPEFSDVLRRNLGTIREFLADPGSWDIEYRKGFMEALYRLHAELRAYVAPMLPNNVDNIVGFLRSHLGAELSSDRGFDEVDEYYRGN